jgi:hypothetical protein
VLTSQLRFRASARGRSGLRKTSSNGPKDHLSNAVGHPRFRADAGARNSAELSQAGARGRLRRTDTCGGALAAFCATPGYVSAVQIAYVDESGNPTGTSSKTYALGCVLVDGDAWPETFDKLIAYRRWLRRQFGVPVRAELRAANILRNSGDFEPLALPERMRHDIYRQTMRLHAKIGLQTFAVVIRTPELVAERPELNARDVAWDYLLQRLRNVTVYPPTAGTTVLLVHDEGEAVTVRKLARKARRAGTAGSMFGTGMLRVPFEKLIDDPVPRQSAHSYFVQLADLAAYAAFRRLYPPPARLVPIVDSTTWDELGDARRAEVTYSRDPVGIVHWPPAAPPDEEEPPG